MRPAEPDRFDASTLDANSRTTPAQFLRARDAARHIGLAEKTLANWRSAGKGPRFSRLGRAIVYAREELDRFVEACLQD
jgi:predicted DNA-binding transcriptional regulator AlpA